MKKIIIGTRKSKLALWQAEHVADLLQKAGAETELVTLETKGDKILDVTIAKIGSKGVFTEEIEELLRAGEIDIAVHSAKDLQSELDVDFEIIAFGEREKVNDVLVSRKAGLNLATPGITIGTSSTRRVATLRRNHPGVNIVDMRGNLQTRIGKMDAGDCDALLLAYAGVHRMGYHDLIAEELHTGTFVPPVGQGSLAIEAMTSIDAKLKAFVRKVINHSDSERCLLAERAYLKVLQGGCSIPSFAYCKLDDGQLNIHGGIYSLDGAELVEYKMTGSVENPKQLGQELANKVLDNGGKEILDGLR